VQELTGIDETRARRRLEQLDWSVRAAIGLEDPD
jgi:hypothetical protein